MLALLMWQLLVAAAWALSARRLAGFHMACTQWSASAGLAALSAGCLLGSDAGPSAIAITVAQLSAITAALMLRRGLRALLNLKFDDAQALLLLGMVAIALVLAEVLWPAQASGLRGMTTAVGLLWVLMQGATQAWPALRAEFGKGAAFAILAPQWAGASILATGVSGAAAGRLSIAVGALAPSAGDAAELAMASGLVEAAALLWVLLSFSLHAGLAWAVVLRSVAGLRHLSQRDALTGLYNRMEWTRQLDGHHRWLGRYDEAYALLMLDVDHFKDINDTLGHAAGDAVLITLAQLLTASARDVDVVGRLGGEEFCVLLPRADLVSARRAAERLRQAIGDTEISWRHHTIRLTVSIGVAIADDAQEPAQRALDRADQAMLQAKRSGRNRTVVARPAPG